MKDILIGSCLGLVLVFGLYVFNDDFNHIVKEFQTKLGISQEFAKQSIGDEIKVTADILRGNNDTPVTFVAVEYYSKNKQLVFSETYANGIRVR